VGGLLNGQEGALGPVCLSRGLRCMLGDPRKLSTKRNEKWTAISSDDFDDCGKRPTRIIWFG